MMISIKYKYLMIIFFYITDKQYSSASKHLLMLLKPNSFLPLIFTYKGEKF